MTDNCAKAEALRLAKAYLEKMGWRYGPKDIGKTAKEILDAMEGQTND